MFKDVYRKKFDAIRPDPALRQAIEERMNERQYGSDRRSNRMGMSRRMIAVLAALLALMLAATAYAVVRGNLLRVRLEEQGDTTIAAQVQDVHISEAVDGFGFTIDEVVWEDGTYYLSCTVSVPDDGSTYLCGLHEPELNGARMSAKTANYFGTTWRGDVLYGMGGAYPSTFSAILKLDADPATEARADGQLTMQASFFRTNGEIERVDYDGLLAHAVYDPSDLDHDTPIIEATDVLYARTAQESETGEIPMIELYYYGRVKRLRQERVDAINAREDICDRERWNLIEAVALTAQDVVDVGIAEEIAAERELSVALDPSCSRETVYNDVAQHLYEMDGYSVEITEFRLSHFGANITALIRKDGELNYAKEGDADFYDSNPDSPLRDEPLARSYGLCTPDGTALETCWSIFSEACDEKGNLIGIQVMVFLDGIVPLDDVTTLLLAPEKSYTENENGRIASVDYELEEAIALTPIYDPAKPDPTPAPAWEESEWSDFSTVTK